LHCERNKQLILAALNHLKKDIFTKLIDFARKQTKTYEIKDFHDSIHQLFSQKENNRSKYKLILVKKGHS